MWLITMYKEKPLLFDFRLQQDFGTLLPFQLFPLSEKEDERQSLEHMQDDLLVGGSVGGRVKSALGWMSIRHVTER